MKEHESWWQVNLPEAKEMDTDDMGKTFRGWLRGINAESRIVFREFLKTQNYESMLDCASGLCDEYYGIKKNGIDIEYKALDITSKLVEYNKSKGVDILEGSIEKIPFDNNTFDLCYARHVLEHLDYYEVALKEMIRVARKGVVHTFFRKPMNDSDNIETYPASTTLYQNVYSKEKMENFISTLDKVDTIKWLQPESLNHGRWYNGEVILHIKIK